MNILKQRHFLLTVQTVFFYITSFAQTPGVQVSKYGLPIMKDISAYSSSVKADSNKQLIELKSIIPNIVYDLRYATNNNFMRRPMYPVKTKNTFLRLPAARALAQVQKELNDKGMGLKVFDAYRPYSITEKFWELVMDERYVADPKKGSDHNRALAVDLTIIILATGKEIQMPTYFDNFSDTSHQSFMQLPFDALQNRKMLRDTMEKHGFIFFETEWWHFSWPNDRKYEVLDLEFKELLRNKD